MTHRMILSQTGHLGRGATTSITPGTTSRNLAKALVVTDPPLDDDGTARQVTELLDKAPAPWEIFSDVAPSPPAQEVQAVLAAFRGRVRGERRPVPAVHPDDRRQPAHRRRRRA